ncbi:FGGY-family carbohydrate kinase [Gemmobacter lanyuensis]
MVAGTYSINETVSFAPKVDARWFCRNGIRAGEWNSMAISPASATNYDWFLDNLMGNDRAEAEAAGQSIHTRIAPEIDAALARPSTLLFHPYLFGSPHGAMASAGFLGLRGWHGRGDLLRAVLEGIAFNHRVHVDALRDGFAPDEARLTGGISRNPAFARLFADVLGMPVTVSATEEAAAWGAALCAGAGVGLFASPGMTRAIWQRWTRFSPRSRPQRRDAGPLRPTLRGFGAACPALAADRRAGTGRQP